MSIKRKNWRKRAEKYKARARYGDYGALRRRTDRVKKPERDAIIRARKVSGANLSEIAKEFERDPRTIASVVASAESNAAVESYIRLSMKRQESERLDQLAEFLSRWKSELPLPLNYLFNKELPDGGVGVPSDTTGEYSILWDPAEDGTVVRRFNIESTSEFQLIRAQMRHSELWEHFFACKGIGGAIIQACSILARDIWACSARETDQEIGAAGEPGINQSFCWTIYAHALKLFTQDWQTNVYKRQTHKEDLLQLIWGDNVLAIINLDAIDKIESVHRLLRNKFGEDQQVKRILGLNEELGRKEDILCQIVDTILQRLALPH
jgi:hypothetical protein